MKNLLVSTSPHIKTSETVSRVMLDVIIALTPALIMAIIFFKSRAAILIGVSVLSAIIIEAVTQKLMKKPIEIKDLSAVVTGILFAFIIPPTLPIWMAVIGVFVSIFFAKMLFGGLGHNIFNPALVGRCFLLASWPVAMTTWIALNGKAGPTILNTWKLHGYKKMIALFGDKHITLIHLFLGTRGGSLGETSTVALLLGAAYLIYRKQITWHIPTFYIGTVFVMSALTGRSPLISIMSGGLILGAFFMATDMVTTPKTLKGKLVFAIGAGLLVVWIREKGGYPEGVAYSILLMNGLTPLIDRWTKPKSFGMTKKSFRRMKKNA